MSATTTQAVEAGHYAHECFDVYSKEVLENRMLPHAFDGLKPVQRRLLLTCDRLNLKPSAAFVKSVQVVGTALAYYHPHSDAACYGALVKVTGTPTLSGIPVNGCNVPLFEGQGNFGDHEDSAAAMRYTECRPSHYAHAALLNREYLSTLPVVTTEAGTDIEQVVLPALLPNLFMNGAEGAAIALATSIPSFEPGSVVDATLAVLVACKEDRLPSREKVAELLAKHLVYQYRYGGDAIHELTAEDFLANNFAFNVLPRWEFVKQSIVVTSIHHKVFNPTAWLEKVRTIHGTRSARDETGQHGLRFVAAFDPKAGVEFADWSRAVLNSLVRKQHCHINVVTGLGEASHTSMTCLADAMLYWLQERFKLERLVLEKRIDAASCQELHLLAVQYAVENREDFFPLLEQDDAETSLAVFYRQWLDDEDAGAAATYILGVSLRTLTKANAEEIARKLADVSRTIDRLEGELSSVVKTTRATTSALVKDLKRTAFTVQSS